MISPDAPSDQIKQSGSDPAAPQIIVLLATRNGAAHLRAQLESFLSQLHRPTRLIISDDGSRDDTPAILAEFAASAPGFIVELKDGPRRGGAQNFLRLLQTVPKGTDFVALSDQDDVWLPDKIARGVRLLSQLPADRPALLGGRS